MLEQIIKIVSEHANIPLETIDENTNIIDFGIDSLVILKIIMELENIFDVHFEDEEIVEIRTVSDLKKNILKKIS